MPRKPRSLECPQCGGQITGKNQHCCRTCGYVLDMARISLEGALEHDRYETWRRRLEWLHAVLWVFASLAVVSVVALNPGWIMFGAGTVGAIVQICWAKAILARRKRR
ncbi:MAG: hypothetical protein V2A79_01790 [Planctomycetota bacterium]